MLKFSISKLVSAVLVLSISDKGIESTVHEGSDEISSVGISPNDLLCWFDRSFALVLTLLSGLDRVIPGEHSRILTKLPEISWSWCKGKQEIKAYKVKIWEI